MEELVAKRYSNALFEVALEGNTLDKTGEELSFITDALNEHPDLFKAIKSPLIKPVEKKEMMKNIFSKHLSRELLNFLYVLIDKSRSAQLKEISTEYHKLLARHNNTIEAVATTAVSMTEEQITELTDKLTKTSGKTVTLTNAVDPSIIGGVFIQIGDKIIDGTLKRRLREIEDRLKEVIL
jgi:F-type H+-transporting ATPase subunit delta